MPSESVEVYELDDLIVSGPSNGLYKSEDFIGTGAVFLDIKCLYKGFSADFSKSRRVRITSSEQQKYGVLRRDILINRVSKKAEGVGKAVLVHEVREPTVYESNMMRFRVDEEKVNPWYIVYYLASKESRRELLSKANISNQASINQENLKSLKIVLPSLEKQIWVVSIAQKCDQLRRTRRYAQQLSDSYLRSVFLQMFGDPVTNSRNWRVLPFEKVVTSRDSKRVPIKESERAKRRGAYPYYGAVGIIDYIDNFLFSETNLLIEEDGMNLITRTKPIAFIVSGKYWVNNHAHVVSDNGTVDLHYLAMSLNIRDVSDFVTGIDQMKLNQDNLDKILIQIPPRSLQEKFAQIVQRFERLQTQQREADRQAEHLFQTVLHRAFRGEL